MISDQAVVTVVPVSPINIFSFCLSMKMARLWKSSPKDRWWRNLVHPTSHLTKHFVLESTEEPFTIDKLPYANFVFRLSNNLKGSFAEALDGALSEAFLQLLDLCIGSVRRIPDYPTGPPSYNFILTLDHMYMIPRSKEEHLLKSGEVCTSIRSVFLSSILLTHLQKLSVNSLGYAGMLLVRSDDEFEALKEEGVVKVLQNVGVPKEDATEEEDE